MYKVQVVEYNPEWPQTFERNSSSYVWPVVADIALTAEHVGSTSVPGLKAKPVIDVCIVVASRKEVLPCIERLGTIGYVHQEPWECRTVTHFSAPTTSKTPPLPQSARQS